MWLDSLYILKSEPTVSTEDKPCEGEESKATQDF